MWCWARCRCRRYDAARDLGNALLDLGVIPDDSPWRIAGPLNAAYLDRGGVADALRSLCMASDAVEPPVVRAMAAFATTPEEFNALADWLDGVHEGIARTTGDAAQIVTSSWRQQAQRARDAISHFQVNQGRRLGIFLPMVLDYDLDEILARAVVADGHLFGKRKRRQTILAELQTAMRGPAGFTSDQITSVLQNLITLRDMAGGLADHVATLPGISLPSRWNPLDPEQAHALERALRALELGAHLRAVIGAGSHDVNAARATIDQTTAEILFAHRTGRESPSDSVRHLGAAWSAFLHALGTRAVMSRGGWEPVLAATRLTWMRSVGQRTPPAPHSSCSSGGCGCGSRSHGWTCSDSVRSPNRCGPELFAALMSRTACASGSHGACWPSVWALLDSLPSRQRTGSGA